MRIAITTVQMPFVTGGAEMLASGLRRACLNAGHEAEIIAFPFRYFPAAELKRAMRVWESEDFDCLNGYTPDLTICLKFPSYYLKHRHKVVWLLHQHRSAYDLWASPEYGNARPTSEEIELKKSIRHLDSVHLEECSRLFTISRNVSRRLLQYCRLESTPLYHPPPFADWIYSAPAEPYIFFPSRLERLKRQHFLIEAMKYVRGNVVALIAGTGGQMPQLRSLIAEMGVEHKVSLLGPVSRGQLLAYYAHCLGVFFGPFDEDYGYVTLEAMLAKKPLITCSDSGGPLELVRSGTTGLVVEPEPKAIAEAIDLLAKEKGTAERMGAAGHELYQRMGISWENVVQQLIS